MKFQNRLTDFLATDPPRKLQFKIVQRSVTQVAVFPFIFGLLFIIFAGIAILRQNTDFALIHSGIFIFFILIGLISRFAQTRILVYGSKVAGRIEKVLVSTGTKPGNRTFKFIVSYQFKGQDKKGRFVLRRQEAHFYKKMHKENKQINFLIRPNKKKVFPLDYMFTFE